MKKLVVFVAAERDRSGGYSPLLDILDNKGDITLLHTNYDYTNEQGKKILEGLPESNLPTNPHPFEQVMRQDFWGIKQSGLVVLDLDYLSSMHLMSAAAVYEKQIIAVSNTLASVPAYFSGSVELVVKPDQILDSISYTLTRTALKDSPNKKAIQDILQKSVKKTLNDLNIPVEHETGPH